MASRPKRNKPRAGVRKQGSARPSSNAAKRLSNPFSTGGGGPHFEAHAQASFVVLMLTGGHAPGLPAWPVTEVKLQGKIDGYETDDLIVWAKDRQTNETRRLLGQVKHTVQFTIGSAVLGEVLNAAWLDFKNPAVFERGKDVIALITSPLSATDHHVISWLLSQARHTKSHEEFFRNISAARFSPARTQEKLAVLRHHLRVANAGVDVPDVELYEFLKSYRVLSYDLGSEVGVVLSLLQSHIAQLHSGLPDFAWGKIVDTVQTWNQSAGTITEANLPDELTRNFKRQPVVHIPEGLVHLEPPEERKDWSTHALAEHLMLGTLLGQWNESNPADIAVIEKLSGIQYSEWTRGLRSLLAENEPPLRVINGVWKIHDRADLLGKLGRRVSDQLLDAFGQACITVFGETSPAFDLSPQTRHEAALHGKSLQHSDALRIGLAEGVAFIGAKPEAFPNCYLGHPEGVATHVVRETLRGADSNLWGTLVDVTPLLAEAAPNEFLSHVDEALSRQPQIFDDLFAQESGGLYGRSYMVGILWALEGLAWQETQLVHVATILSDLASRDPGGRWNNRPANSLTTIFLPWLPQTDAPVQKRLVAVTTLTKQQPNVGWKLIVSLLPNQNQTSSGSHRPMWRPSPPSTPNVAVSASEYRTQVSAYALLAVELAGTDVARLAELIDCLNDLPDEALAALLERLSSAEVQMLSDKQRTEIWKKLAGIVAKHSRHSSAPWAMDDTRLSAVTAVRDRLRPADAFTSFERLFGEDDFELYEGDGDWDQKAAELETRRGKIVEDLAQVRGPQGVTEFVQKVDAPRKVGFSLAHVAGSDLDRTFVEMLGGSTDRKIDQFLDAFVFQRQRNLGWNWVDSMRDPKWSVEHTARFLQALPFEKGTWERADSWLGEHRSSYWRQVWVNPFQATDGPATLEYAVRRLIEFSRPLEAVECLYRIGESDAAFPSSLAIEALLAAAAASEPLPRNYQHHVVDVVKTLQHAKDVSPADIANVEWSYLPLLGRHESVRPVELERRMTSDADFYSQAIQAVYRSDREREKPHREGTTGDRAMASNAWRLLDDIQRTPGSSEDGSIDPVTFSNWMKKVLENAVQSGHVGVTMSHVGQLLSKAPSDPSGLWIHKVVAEALNGQDAEKLREGFALGICNSRGAHWVDPSGNEEKKLAQGYRDKAEAVENAGFFRLATKLRQVADSYDREAKRNQREAGAREE